MAGLLAFPHMNAASSTTYLVRKHLAGTDVNIFSDVENNNSVRAMSLKCSSGKSISNTAPQVRAYEIICSVCTTTRFSQSPTAGCVLGD